MLKLLIPGIIAEPVVSDNLDMTAKLIAEIEAPGAEMKAVSEDKMNELGGTWFHWGDYYCKPYGYHHYYYCPRYKHTVTLEKAKKHQKAVKVEATVAHTAPVVSDNAADTARVLAGIDKPGVELHSVSEEMYNDLGGTWYQWGKYCCKPCHKTGHYYYYCPHSSKLRTKLNPVVLPMPEDVRLHVESAGSKLQAVTEEEKAQIGGQWYHWGGCHCHGSYYYCPDYHYDNGTYYSSYNYYYHLEDKNGAGPIVEEPYSAPVVSDNMELTEKVLKDIAAPGTELHAVSEEMYNDLGGTWFHWGEYYCRPCYQPHHYYYHCPRHNSTMLI